jgi:hypothetical protein
MPVLPPRLAISYGLKRRHFKRLDDLAAPKKHDRVLNLNRSSVRIPREVHRTAGPCHVSANAPETCVNGSLDRCGR